MASRQLLTRVISGLISMIGIGALAASPALAWQPEPAQYGMGAQNNVAVTMKDGTVLRANVYFPTDLKSGQAAAGPFPVILVQTPYGKENANAGGQVSQLAGGAPYLVQRGYIQVVADVRGTGGSRGEWGLFDPVQGEDGATLVDWAAKLPHSDGDVGLLGASYLGIDQFATAADAGSAHVKAMFPIVAGNDLYRDAAFAGGFPGFEFDAFYLGLTGSLNLLLPFEEGNPDLAQALSDHVRDLGDFDAQLVAGVELGGDQAYDQTYWGARNPVRYIQKIADDGIPAFLIGGWYDLFQRGELMNYSSFQNAYAHRPLLGPMAPDQPATPRYQLLQGPWYHVTTGQGLNYRGLDLNGLELAWFDRWLKGIDTGITDTPTPLHLEDLASGRYIDAAHYPIDQATPTTYFLSSGGSLQATPPGNASGSDPLVFTGTEIPCTSSSEQWAAGAGVIALSFFNLTDPCVQDATPSQLGPGTQNYTTTPFTSPTLLAGPIGATLYATSTTTDTELVVQISDVAPSGAARPLTSGLLEGNQRALDDSMTWFAPDGRPLVPYHPYTKAAQTPVLPGRITRYDIEVPPTFNTLAPGHRLRVTVATGDFPHALPTLAQGPALLGGVYALQHSRAYASSVELPLAPAPPSGANTLGDAGQAPRSACPAATGSLSGRRIGRLRLGITRSRARSAFPRGARRSRGSSDVFCLRGGGIQAAYATRKLLRGMAARSSNRLRGRTVLLLTSNRRYALRGIRPGDRLRAARRRVRLGRSYRLAGSSFYLPAAGPARGVLRVKQGRIVEIGIADPELMRTRSRALLAGL